VTLFAGDADAALVHIRRALTALAGKEALRFLRER
jgi:hypothetical protein